MSNLKLTRDEIQKLIYNNGGTHDTNNTVRAIEAAFVKVGVEVLHHMDAEARAYSRMNTYVWSIFGPESCKEHQIQWILNCAAVGGPDDHIAGKALHIMRDPPETILKLLKIDVALCYAALCLKTPWGANISIL